MTDERSWHALSIEEIYEELETSPDGLHQEDVQQRIEKYGRNEIESDSGVNKLALLLHQVKNPLIFVLLIAGIIAFIAGETIDTIVILVVIVLNTAVGFIQEYRAEAALEALKSRAAPKADVVRCPEEGECTEMNVDADEIVPGDIILLTTGDKVPADGRIFEAVNLAVDEAMLTGESLPVEKETDPLDEGTIVADRKNMVFGGSVVIEGRGKAVITATGKATQMGQIATLIKETEKAETPLQRQTYDLGRKMGMLAVLAGGMIFIIGLTQGIPLQDLFLFVIAAVVSAIPEGLPAVMTITLAVGVNRMAKRNAIIRRLQAVDTLGATSVICSDKTGTITTNQMTVQRIYLSGDTVEVSGGGFNPEGEFSKNGTAIDPLEDRPLKLALLAGALSNDSRLERMEAENGEQWQIKGDPTEGALIVAARKAGLEEKRLAKEHPRLDEIPFSSITKYMATFNDFSEEGPKLFLKGAPETVLNYCTRYQKGDETLDLDEKTRQSILEENTQMAGDALRVLGVAYRPVKAGEVDSLKEKLKQEQGDLIFIGLFGMMDPPREEVTHAINLCKSAGVKVIMATGDHKITGEAIARQVGIIEGDEKVITGQEVEAMSEEELDAIIQETGVFARVSPAVKQEIVASLQRKGYVVAMTGDGVNDAPALKGAEIGVAMGITGTDVTRETAEMVLTDDNFASIVSAVEEGRVVFQNVRKVVKFLIATNFGEILTIVGALLLLPITHLIFTPVQILWVNLVTDGLLDITIALEPKEGDVMNSPPRKPETRIINREMLFNTLFVAIFMAVGTIWIYSSYLASATPEHANTVAFITIAMFQVFNSLNVRSETRSVFQLGLFSNKYLIGAILISVFLLVLSTIVPFLQVALNTNPLTMQEWGLIILVSGSIFIADEIRKLIRRMIVKR
jgi:P-type Ca2+ transporter type 2C